MELLVAEMNRKMGFRVMLNEHEILEKDGEKIGLVGVENWGFSEENWRLRPEVTTRSLLTEWKTFRSISC